MTRLFFRFYLGVILILFIAWLIQAYVFRGTTEAENIRVVEDALGGGTISVRDDLVAGGKENFAETLAQVRARFAYPVETIERSENRMSPEMHARLDDGAAVLHQGKMYAALPDSDLLVQLGPLPQFVVPTRRDILLGLGSVFLLAAISIAILLRPIAKQLRNVERTALAIAEGDLTARIGNAKSKQALPIVRAFNKMADRVEKLLRSQKELLQAVSHELRTPLAKIKFATELVRSADDSDKRSIRIDAIDESTDKLNVLVSELLAYTRYDEDNHILEREQVDATDLVMEAIAIHASLYPDIEIQFIETGGAKILTTYRPGLLRAVGNLISNAGKYAKSKVLVRVDACDSGYCFSVEDDGSGIAEKDREAIFEPFKRLALNSKPGTGLGLALVQRICQRLGGKVSVDESSLGGAHFKIFVPSGTTIPQSDF